MRGLRRFNNHPAQNKEKEDEQHTDSSGEQGGAEEAAAKDEQLDNLPAGDTAGASSWSDSVDRGGGVKAKANQRVYSSTSKSHSVVSK